MRTFSCFAPVLDPPLQRGWGTIVNSKSGIIFMNLLLRNYEAERTEIDMSASEECLDVKSCSAWRLTPVWGLRGRPTILATDI